MTKKQLLTPFLWHEYSPKIKQFILRPHCIGRIEKEEAAELKCDYSMIRGGDLSLESLVLFTFIADPKDGTLIDAKFIAYGETPLFFAAEACLTLAIGKSYDRAANLSFQLVEKHLYPSQTKNRLPPELKAPVDFCLDLIRKAMKDFAHIPLPKGAIKTPLPEGVVSRSEGVDQFPSLSKEEKLALIEEVLTREIRPYIAMDQGGVSIIDLKDGFELVIKYEGACTSCFSSVGATLSTIQSMLRSHIHQDLKVTPSLEHLSL